MIKIAFVIYRQWGYEIFKNIYVYQKVRKDFVIDALIYPSEYEFSLNPKIKKTLYTKKVDPHDSTALHKILKEKDIDIVCLFSWSWIVKKPLLDDFICLCLHPSSLPKYRGGTPIQNQIMNGEINSAATLFKMNEGIDAGDIYQQTAISFLGNVNDIFNRMIDVGTIMTKNLITDAVNNELKFKPQKNLDKYLPFKRRKPSQSEVQLTNIEAISFKELNNLVRGLLDPYPNAFIQLANKRLTIQEVSLYKYLPKNGSILENTNANIEGKNIFLKVKDGFAKLQKYKVV